MYLLSLLGVLLFKFSLSWGKQKWKVQTSNSPKQEEHFWLAERKFQNKNGQMSDLDFSQENNFLSFFEPWRDFCHLFQDSATFLVKRFEWVLFFWAGSFLEKLDSERVYLMTSQGQINGAWKACTSLLCNWTIIVWLAALFVGCHLQEKPFCSFCCLDLNSYSYKVERFYQLVPNFLSFLFWR